MALPSDESVRYDILIEAKQAIQDLRMLGVQTADNTTKMRTFSNLVLASSKEWNISWQQALATYKQLNAELSKQKKGTIFGQTGGQDLFKQSEQYIGALEEAGRVQTEVADSATEMGEKTEVSTRRMVRGVDAVRIALGALVAMLVFNVIQAVQNAFKMMINNVREAELAVYNLINAEKRLSEQGIDVTPKGLQETIDAVSKLVPILSKIQVDELVSRIATNVAPALHLTNEQIRQMAEATALLYVRNKALGKSFDEVESQLTNAFLTGKVSQGINQLGVKISDQIVKDEALRLGLVKTAKEFDSLSGEVEAHVKSVAMLSVVYKNAKQDVGAIGDYLETTDAKIETSKKLWSDLLTTFGQMASPLLKAFFDGLVKTLQGFNDGLEKNKQTLLEFFAVLTGVFLGAEKLTEISKRGFFEKLNFKENFKETIQAIYDGIQNAKKGAQDLSTATDTATASIDSLAQAADDFDASGFANKIEDILKDAENAREDLANKLAQKKADLDTEYQRKAVDAEKDYNRKVADINKDAERQIANIKQKQRQDDLKAEQDYQNKLWELRMRYLMDLEDALHARDARQVLRLMKQYAIDKEALERKKALDDKQRKDDQKNQLADIELKRKQRLDDAKLEYQQKLADLNVAKQRELDDINTWYAREQADLELSIKRKLETLIKGWVDEQKITEANAAAVYGILLKYFGPGGMTDALYAYMRQNLAQSTMPIPWSIPNAPATTETGTTGGKTGDSGHGGRHMADGGTLLATRPTTVTFGEAGAELASFVPLGRIGRDVGKVSGMNGGASGMNGNIKIEMLLSPDLEARIVENSMNSVANVIVKVNNSK